MTKKLEAFSKERQALDELYDVAGNIQNLKEDYIILKSVLQRLEAIENANPNEALNCLKDIYRNGVFISEISFTKQRPTNISPETNKSISEQCDTIKQSLLKAQEQEKVLEIIKYKHYEDYMLTFETYEAYQENANRVYEGELVIDWNNEKQLLELNLYTQEEFDTLKRYLR